MLSTFIKDIIIIIIISIIIIQKNLDFANVNDLNTLKP